MIETQPATSTRPHRRTLQDRHEKVVQQPVERDSDLCRDVWIVIPAYNESDGLHHVIAGLHERGYDQVVVVDDGSSDSTHLVAAQADAWVVRHAVNRGQGAALQTGIDFAVRHHAEIIVTFDADDQHDPKDIPAMIGPILDGQCDVVLGSRFLGTADQIPWARKVLLKAAVLFTRITTRLHLTDTHNGFRAFTRDAAPKLRFAEDGMAHASEFLRNLSDSKLRFREVPVTIRYTEHSLAKGQSNRAAVGILFRMFIARIVR